MSPGYELVPVHDMRDMSMGHIDTFTFCYNALMETDHIPRPREMN